MPAEGQRTTGNYRWSESGTEVLHAYPWTWNKDSPKSCAPACGGQAPRRKLGRGMAPQVGATLCASCALVIGFRRRPRTSQAWALRRAKLQEQHTTVDGVRIMAELVELRALVLRLLRHVTGADAPSAGLEPGARAVMAEEPDADV